VFEKTLTAVGTVRPYAAAVRDRSMTETSGRQRRAKAPPTAAHRLSCERPCTPASPTSRCARGRGRRSRSSRLGRGTASRGWSTSPTGGRGQLVSQPVRPAGSTRGTGSTAPGPPRRRRLGAARVCSGRKGLVRRHGGDADEPLVHPSAVVTVTGAKVAGTSSSQEAVNRRFGHAERGGGVPTPGSDALGRSSRPPLRIDCWLGGSPVVKQSLSAGIDHDPSFGSDELIDVRSAMGNRPARAGAQNAPSRSRSRKIHKRHGTVRQQALTAQGSLATTLFALGELDEARQLQEAAWSGPGGCSVSLEQRSARPRRPARTSRRRPSDGPPTRH
jgi:hypothetical protein